MEMQVVKFDLDAALVAKLDVMYKDIQVIETKEDLEMVKGGQRAYRELRLSVDAWHKDKKADAIRFGKWCDEEKKRVYALLSVEEHLKAVRQKYEDKAKEEDRARVKAINDRIMNIRAYGMGLLKLSSLEISERIDTLKAAKVEEPDFQEFVGEAMATVHNTLADLEIAITETMAREAAEKQRKEEDARLEGIRKEQAEAQKKIDEANATALALQDRMAEQQRQIDAQVAQLERDKQIEQDRKDREAFEKEATEKARVKAEADAKEKAEQDEKDRLEAAAKAEADRVEAERIAKEAVAHAEALRPDRVRLMAWANRIMDMTLPDLKDKKAKAIADQALNDIFSIANSVMQEAKELGFTQITY